MTTRIRNATVLLPGGPAEVDVLIDGTRIGDVDAARQISADETVDADGLYLLPGIIDDQVHFREPGLTHKEDLAHASRACAKGGVTSFLEMPNTNPATVTRERLHEKLELGRRESRVNYGFYIGGTQDNLEELQQVQRTPGIKLFLGSSTGPLLVDEQEVLERIFAETTLPIAAHCEDEQRVRERAKAREHVHDVAVHSEIRDHQAALLSTTRAVDLAHRHGHRLHVLHLSTGDEIDVVRDHRGVVTCEVCLHHLFFNRDDYERLGTRVQMNPSLKDPDDNRRLWQGLLDGHIQVVATDHAPHTLEEKSRPYPESPSGLPAVENSLALMLHQVHLGRCTLEQVVQWMCEAPARVWDLVSKGRIERDADADLVLVDLERTQTIRDEDQLTKCGWSPWHGTRVTGWPVRTWVMGREVFHDGTVHDHIRGDEIRFDHGLGGYWST